MAAPVIRKEIGRGQGNATLIESVSEVFTEFLEIKTRNKRRGDFLDSSDEDAGEIGTDSLHLGTRIEKTARSRFFGLVSVVDFVSFGEVLEDGGDDTSFQKPTVTFHVDPTFAGIRLTNKVLEGIVHVINSNLEEGAIAIYPPSTKRGKVTNGGDLRVQTSSKLSIEKSSLSIVRAGTEVDDPGVRAGKSELVVVGTRTRG